jgi:peptidoglycan/LPS O-acetylase OafA/YrhL
MATNRIDGISFLRGISILFVVFIHLLAGLPLHLFSQHEWHPVFITLDQFGRIAVPLFLAASGFLLEKKHRDQGIEAIAFWKYRLLQLLPLYIFWSLLLFLLRIHVPVWNIPPADLNLQNVFRVLFLGQGDYHLYFVPLLVQMYLFYPFFHKLIKRFSWAFLAFTIITQGLLFLFIEQHTSSNSLPSIFASDGKQYLFFLNWWLYFVLGMFIALHQVFVQKWGEVWFIATLVLGVLSAHESFAQITEGRDPLFALRFTRLPVLLYTSSFLLFAWAYLERIPLLAPKPLRSVLIWMGDKSFLIYLSHTIFLRLGIDLYYARISLPTFLLIGLLTLVALLISIFWSRLLSWNIRWHLFSRKDAKKSS